MRNVLLGAALAALALMPRGAAAHSFWACTPDWFAEHARMEKHFGQHPHSQAILDFADPVPDTMMTLFTSNDGRWTMLFMAPAQDPEDPPMACFFARGTDWEILDGGVDP